MFLELKWQPQTQTSGPFVIFVESHASTTKVRSCVLCTDWLHLIRVCRLLCSLAKREEEITPLERLWIGSPNLQNTLYPTAKPVVLWSIWEKKCSFSISSKFKVPTNQNIKTTDAHDLQTYARLQDGQHNSALKMKPFAVQPLNYAALSALCRFLLSTSMEVTIF